MIGLRKTLEFFARKQKWKVTVCFLLGILLVFARLAIVGIVIEFFGFGKLFGVAHNLA